MIVCHSIQYLTRALLAQMIQVKIPKSRLDGSLMHTEVKARIQSWNAATQRKRRHLSMALCAM